MPPRRNRAAESVPSPESGPESIGARIRAERERQRIGVRELARQVNVSASLISQVELGKASPSVGTLYAIVNALGISVDQLFFEAGTAAAPAPAEDAGARVRPLRKVEAERKAELELSPLPERSEGPVVRRGDRKSIQLQSHVLWQRLTPSTEHDIDFLYVVYDVGGASCPEDSLMRHSGREYGHVIKGRLNVTVGFDTYELGPGDSISFDSSVPHRLFNAGEEPAEGIWFVLGRGGDSRVASA